MEKIFDLSLKVLYSDINTYIIYALSICHSPLLSYFCFSAACFQVLTVDGSEIGKKVKQETHHSVQSSFTQHLLNSVLISPYNHLWLNDNRTRRAPCLFYTTRSPLYPESFCILSNHQHLVIPICFNDVRTGHEDYKTQKTY